VRRHFARGSRVGLGVGALPCRPLPEVNYRYLPACGELLYYHPTTHPLTDICVRSSVRKPTYTYCGLRSMYVTHSTDGVCTYICVYVYNFADLSASRSACFRSFFTFFLNDSFYCTINLLQTVITTYVVSLKFCTIYYMFCRVIFQCIFSNRIFSCL
jgi:hypothetical protein